MDYFDIESGDFILDTDDLSVESVDFNDFIKCEELGIKIYNLSRLFEATRKRFMECLTLGHYIKERKCVVDCLGGRISVHSDLKLSFDYGKKVFDFVVRRDSLYCGGIRLLHIDVPSLKQNHIGYLYKIGDYIVVRYYLSFSAMNDGEFLVPIIFKLDGKILGVVKDSIISYGTNDGLLYGFKDVNDRVFLTKFIMSCKGY